MNLPSLIAAGCVAAVLSATPVLAAEAPPPEAAKAEPADTDGGAKASAREVARATHHTVSVDGRTLPYTATAGTLTLRDDEGKAIASMFYVA